MMERLKRWLGEVSLEDTKTVFHLAYAIAPAIAASVAVVIALFLPHDVSNSEALRLSIEIGLIIMALCVNGYILWRKSEEAKETRELNPLHTFIWNRLLPNRSGDEQTYDVKVAIIDDVKTNEFRKDLQQRFKNEFDIAKLKELLLSERRLKNPILTEAKLDDLTVEIKDPNLYFASIDLGPEKFTSDEQALLKTSKKNFKTNLKDKTAVVLVRTEASDKRGWVYEALSDWGNDNSEIPILFAQDGEKPYTDDENAKKFLWMPKDAKSLPWRLLQRSLTRASAWRFQATFNTAMFWNGFYVLLLIVNMAVIHAAWIRHRLITQQEVLINTKTRTGAVNKIVGDAMDAALATERELRTWTKNPRDSKFAVSYWYRIDEKPHILVTTEFEPAFKVLDNNYQTIIGCVFSETNRLVEAAVKTDNTFETVAYNRYGKVEMPKCTMGKFAQKDIKNIVCVSYERDSSSATVGICAFTQDTDNTFFDKATSQKTRNFLWERVEYFHHNFAMRIYEQKDLSLAERSAPLPTPTSH